VDFETEVIALRWRRTRVQWNNTK